MSLKQFMFFGALLLVLSGWSQSMPQISGVVVDELGKGLPQCHIHYHNQCVVTDNSGHFSIVGLPGSQVNLSFSFVGYLPKDTLVKLPTNIPLRIRLKPQIHALNEVNVNGQRGSSPNLLQDESMSKLALMQSYSGNLVKSLEKRPGIHSMDIGTNASKPIVRGLGFSRVVVSENGIKQEGQQWGADHGLELDFFTAEQVSVVKGASSIEHGSGAMGGVISVRNGLSPVENSRNGSFTLAGRTVNTSGTASLAYQLRNKNWFWKFRATAVKSGDYAVPADTIVYLTRQIPLYNRRVKNSAGTEQNWMVQNGYLSPRLRNVLTASQVLQRSGFFPGAHGIPSLERVADDGSRFNIEMPYQQVSHLKLVDNLAFSKRGIDYEADLGWQQNHRQEISAFHTHYPGQDVPAVDPNLELDFRLNTYSANGKARLKFDFNRTSHTVLLGMQNQLQLNNITGYNFLLPQFRMLSSGLFVSDQINFSDRVTASLALRYDVSQLQIEGFYDEVLFSYLESRGNTSAESYAWRSIEVNRTMGDLSWLAGFRFAFDHHTSATVNLGRSYRNPTAMELSANGIHHGSFRHEQGNPNLDSELGYYADASFQWKNERTEVEWNTYAYRFSNYIFLNPTGEWSVLPHAGQIYRYSQSGALLAGSELKVEHRFSELTGILVQAELLFSRQLSDAPKLRYPLPFSPPANGYAEWFFEPNLSISSILHLKLNVNVKYVMAQNRVARNELKTPDAKLLGAGISFAVMTKGEPIQVSINGSNLLNSRYLNHISFYRKLELPEPGRDVKVVVQIPF